MTIRAIEPGEAHLIHDLAHRIWPHTFAEILSPAQIAYMLEWMYSIEKLQSQIAAGHLFAVIEQDGEALGFIGLEPGFPEKDALRIHKLYVLPDRQGSGLGKHLLSYADSIARSKGLKRLHLNVNRFNNAVHFYTHSGFSIIREEDIDIGQGYLMEDFVMDRPVTEPTEDQ